MEEFTDVDSPLAYYKLAFPNDKDAESKVMKLLYNTANQVLGKYCIDLENIEQDGLSMLELELYTIIKIDALREPEMHE